MKKILFVSILLLFSANAETQISGLMIAEKGIPYDSKWLDYLESMKDQIKTVNGKDWVCYPKPGMYYKNQLVRVVDGAFIPINGDGTVIAIKIDLIQINFKTKNKTLIKGGSLSSVTGYAGAIEKINKLYPPLIEGGTRRADESP
jgi:hypothetical protein